MSSKHRSYSRRSLEATIDIPEDFSIGVVIGTKGANLTAMKDKTGCHYIRVDPHKRQIQLKAHSEEILQHTIEEYNAVWAKHRVRSLQTPFILFYNGNLPGSTTIHFDLHPTASDRPLYRMRATAEDDLELSLGSLSLSDALLSRSDQKRFVDGLRKELESMCASYKQSNINNNSTVVPKILFIGRLGNSLIGESFLPKDRTTIEAFTPSHCTFEPSLSEVEMAKLKDMFQRETVKPVETLRSFEVTVLWESGTLTKISLQTDTFDQGSRLQCKRVAHNRMKKFLVQIVTLNLPRDVRVVVDYVEKESATPEVQEWARSCSVNREGMLEFPTGKYKVRHVRKKIKEKYCLKDYTVLLEDVESLDYESGRIEHQGNHCEVELRSKIIHTHLKEVVQGKREAVDQICNAVDPYLNKLKEICNFLR